MPVNLPLPIPDRIAALPRDHRGYPVPWFVGWIDGKPEFRLADSRKLSRAIERRVCWVCGHKLGPTGTFTIGPMCAVNRISSEPPSHRECAEWSARACPFLTNPAQSRRDGGLPAESVSPGGEMILRNPGITLLWVTRHWSVEGDGRGGTLFSLATPTRCMWYAEGRQAIRAEVLASIESGLPLLQDAADAEGPDAQQELARMLDVAMPLVPA